MKRWALASTVSVSVSVSVSASRPGRGRREKDALGVLDLRIAASTTGARVPFQIDRFTEAADVGLDAVAGPVRYPDHWYDVLVLVLALARAGRWVELRANLPTALMTVPFYCADRTMVAWVLWLEHAGRADDAAAVFHGASKHVSYFRLISEG